MEMAAKITTAGHSSRIEFSTIRKKVAGERKEKQVFGVLEGNPEKLGTTKCKTAWKTQKMRF